MSDVTVHETDAIHRRISDGNVTPSKRKASTSDTSPSPKKARTPASPLREVKENGLDNKDKNGGRSEAPVNGEHIGESNAESGVKLENVAVEENAENSGNASHSSPDEKSSRRKSQSPTKFTFVPKSLQSQEVNEERIDSPDSVRKSNRTPKKSKKILESEETKGFLGEPSQVSPVNANSTTPVSGSSTTPVAPEDESKKAVGKYLGIGRPKGSKNRKQRSDKGKGRKKKRSEPHPPDMGIDPRFGGKVIIQAKTKTEKATEIKGPRIKVSGPFTSPKSIKFLDQEEEVKERRVPKANKEQQRLYRASAVLTNDPTQIDDTWTCIFCQKYSHYRHLGDLFGPYFVNLPDEPDEEFLPITRRRATSECRTEPDELEVWFHERCLYWAPNVYMLAGKIIGLEVVLGELRNSACNHCHLEGATIACYHRGCDNRSHFPCAAGRWQLDEHNYRCYCPIHHV